MRKFFLCVLLNRHWWNPADSKDLMHGKIRRCGRCGFTEYKSNLRQ